MYQHKRKNHFRDSRHRSHVIQILINFAALFDPNTIKLKKKKKKDKTRKEKRGLQACLSKASVRGLIFVGSNLAAIIKR